MARRDDLTARLRISTLAPLRARLAKLRALSRCSAASPQERAVARTKADAVQTTIRRFQER
jgi:hypothetical protein